MKLSGGNSKQMARAGWLAAMVLSLAASGLAADVETKPEAMKPAGRIVETKVQVKRQIVISVTDRKLALLEDDKVVKVYPVAVGKESTPSPTGTFQIVNRLEKPTYYHAGKVVEPGPENPLGTRWMGLSQKGYGIHGTNAPKSIGRAASHGCIRMAKADLEDLFKRVQVGDVVEIRGDRDELVTAVFGGQADVTIQAQQTALAQVSGQ